MKPRIFTTALLAMVFVGLGAYFSNLYAEKTRSSDSIYANQFALVKTGEKTSLAEYRNKILVVNFWASWCPPCIKEMPELEKIQQEMADKDVQVVGIGLDEPGNLQVFARRQSITYPLFEGGVPGNEFAEKLGFPGTLPYTVLFDKSGKVVKTYHGYEGDLHQLRNDILNLK